MTKHEPAGPSGHADLSGELADPAGVDSVAVGDEVGGGVHALTRDLGEVVCSDDVAGLRRESSQSIEGEDFHMGGVVAPGVIEDRDESFVCAWYAVRSVESGEEALARRSLFATAVARCHATASSRIAHARVTCATSRAGHDRGEPGRAPPAARAPQLRDERVRQGSARPGQDALRVGPQEGAGRQARRLEDPGSRVRREHLLRRFDRVRRPAGHPARRQGADPVGHRQPRHALHVRRAPCGRRDPRCVLGSVRGGVRRHEQAPALVGLVGRQPDDARDDARGARRRSRRRRAAAGSGRQDQWRIARELQGGQRPRGQHDLRAGGAEGHRARREVRRPRAAGERQRVDQAGDGRAGRTGSHRRRARHLSA